MVYELEEFCVDVIWKEIIFCDVDGNFIIEDVFYYFLGFDLGNGLFYDLNGNFVLCLKCLFEFDG